MIYIAGPCAAESEEQVLETARALAQMDGLIFRAGVWKPRTRPESFQGVGDEGLLWLNRVQNEIGLPVATEVANAEQVNKALAAGIQYLWVGARTCASPITVQAIANAINISPQRTHLRGVFIKNPVNEDVALWEGNIRRFQHSDLGFEIYAVHRGCNHQPCWQMAYQLRIDMPQVGLLLDPSHLSGDAERVSSLCRDAAELQYNGLMVEVHPHPKQALSDAKQQITPAEFAAIIHASQVNYSTPIELRWLRKMIDEVDDRLWNAIAQRMAVSERIGAFKKANHMEVLQPTRFSEIMTNRLAWAEKQRLSKEAVQTILTALHEESIRKQQ